VGVSVSVGRAVNVSEGIAEAVSVGMGVDISAEGRLVDVSAGTGEFEAGTCPVLLELQAARNRVQIISRISFLFFMA
jgi:hypothetical protein